MGCRPIVVAALAVLGLSCVSGGARPGPPASTTRWAPVTRPPSPAPDAAISSEPAAGVLGREYHALLAPLAPLPGRVVGLVMPADSRWGRSLEWIGEAVSSQPNAYRFSGDEKRVYQLYAAGHAPRILGRQGPALVAGGQNDWGLTADAHLAEVEFGSGFGSNQTSTYQAEATGAKVLEGTPGYPRSGAALMDAARAEFDRFLATQRSAMARVVEAEAAKKEGGFAGAPQAEQVTDTLFPLWDDGRKRLVVLFHRRVMRMVEGSLPCTMVYEGMPPEPSSMPFRYGYGAEVALKVELSASGALTAARQFLPSAVRIASNVEPDAADGRRGEPVCPGSPGLNSNYPMLPELPEAGEPTEARCGNGKRDLDGPTPERCDGEDLGGASCSGLGYFGGPLACDPACALTVETCSVAAPEAKVLPSAFPADGGALAFTGAQVEVAATVGRGIEVHRLDPGSLERRGEKVAWTLAEGAGSTVSIPFAARLGASLVIAATVYGAAPRTLLLRLGEDGRLVETGGVPGRALFLVAHGDRALLGVLSERSGARLETVVVDAQGRTLGEARPAINPGSTTGFVRGAAVATPGGWFASVGTNGTFYRAAPFAQLDRDGRLIRAGSVEAQSGQMAVARGPRSSFLVFTHPTGVLAAEVADDGRTSRPVKLTSDPASWMVAAAVEGGRLVGWASDYSKLHRYEVDLDGGRPAATKVIEAPFFIPIAAALRGSELWQLFQVSRERNGAQDRALWLYRDPPTVR